MSATALFARLPRGDEFRPAPIAYAGLLRSQGEPTTGAFLRAGGNGIAAGRAGTTRLPDGGLILGRAPRKGARSPEDLPRGRLILLPDREDESEALTIGLRRHTERDAGVSQAARHELRFSSREVPCDRLEFTLRRPVLDPCLILDRGGIGILILQLAAAVATANDMRLELLVAAATVADDHAGRRVRSAHAIELLRATVGFLQSGAVLTWGLLTPARIRRITICGPPPFRSRTSHRRHALPTTS